MDSGPAVAGEGGSVQKIYKGRRENALPTDQQARSSTLQSQTSYALAALPGEGGDLPPSGRGTVTLQKICGGRGGTSKALHGHCKHALLWLSCERQALLREPLHLVVHWQSLPGGSTHNHRPHESTNVAQDKTINLLIPVLEHALCR